MLHIFSDSRPDAVCDGSNASQEGAIDVVDLEKADNGPVFEEEAAAVDSSALRDAD